MNIRNLCTGKNGFLNPFQGFQRSFSIPVLGRTASKLRDRGRYVARRIHFTVNTLPICIWFIYFLKCRNSFSNTQTRAAWASSTGGQTISMYWTLTAALDAFSCRPPHHLIAIGCGRSLRAFIHDRDPHSRLFSDTRASDERF